MPCAKGMSKCKPSCAHKRFVEEYQLAREAQVVAEEAETYGDPEMIEERRFNGIHPVTFKEWLVGNAQADYAHALEDGEAW